MKIDLKLEQFEGPFDLLLHLIKETKLDIFEINLEDIVNQYLEFIQNVDTINLNVLSEYLVMASELIEIKSKKLLPRQIEESEEEDPYFDLRNKILEYKIYKDLTNKFKEKELLRKEIWTKAPEKFDSLIDTEINYDNELDVSVLSDVLNDFLLRQKEREPLNTKVANKELSVSKRRFEIKSILQVKGRVNFLELFDVINKEYIVVTFLSILEMAKEKELVIRQDKNFDEIYCEVLTNE